MATSEQSSPLPLMATQQAGSRAGKGHCPSAPRQIQWPRGLAGLPRGSAFGVSPPRRTASHCSQALTARRQRDLGKEYRLRQWASSCVIRTEGPVRCVAAAPVAAMRPDVFGGRPSSERGDHYSRGMATRVAAWLAAAIFFVVAAFQAALVFGAPWGEYTQGGGTSGALASSGRLFAAVSCVLSIVMAGAILARAGEGPLQRLPARVVTVLAWVATVYAAVAVVLNIITRSTAERALWGPVSIVLLVLVTTVMVTTRRT